MRNLGATVFDDGEVEINKLQQYPQNRFRVEYHLLLYDSRGQEDSME